MAGEWKTIEQRELKARGARKKQRRSAAATASGVGIAAYGTAKGGLNDANLIRWAGKVSRPSGTKAALRSAGKVALSRPAGAAVIGGGALAAGGATSWGANRGVEAYHQHKINERRRINASRKVSKSMNTSAWGVDHGVEIAKREKYTRNEKLTGAATGLLHTTPVGPIAAGAQAKKGKRAKVGFRAAGRGIVEGTPGAIAGGLIGHAATKGSVRGIQVGATLGGAPTTAHGVMASMRNSRRKGWMKNS